MTLKELKQIKVLQKEGILKHIKLGVASAINMNNGKEYKTIQALWGDNFDEINKFADMIRANTNCFSLENREEIFSVVNHQGHLVVDIITILDDSYSVMYNPNKGQRAYYIGSYYSLKDGTWSNGTYDFYNEYNAKKEILSKLYHRHMDEYLVTVRVCNSYEDEPIVSYDIYRYDNEEMAKERIEKLTLDYQNKGYKVVRDDEDNPCMVEPCGDWSVEITLAIG